MQDQSAFALLRRRADLHTQAKLPADPIGDWYQGGPYCSDEFDGGIDRAPV